MKIVNALTIRSANGVYRRGTNNQSVSLTFIESSTLFFHHLNHFYIGEMMIEQMMKFGGEFSVAGVKKTRGHEGSGFECIVLRNGKKIGEAADYGDGGAVMFRIKDDADYQELLRVATEKYPDQKYERDCTFVSTMVNYYESIKRMKTTAKTKLMCLDPENIDQDENGIQQSYTVFKMLDTPENRKLISDKYPTYIFLNDAINEAVLPSAKGLK